MPDSPQPVQELSGIPEQYRRAAIVCSAEGCGFGITTDDTEHWEQTIGVPVEGAQCSRHPGAAMVRGWLDDRWLWR